MAGRQALWLLLLLAATAAAARPVPSPSGDGSSSSSSAGTSSASTSDYGSSSRPRTLYVAFVNDVHNRLEQEDPSTSTPCSAKADAEGRCVGGWPRISTAVRALRQRAAREHAAVLFLDAGDEFTGSLWDIVYQGQTVGPALQNAVHVDAMTMGNHELDGGPALLGSYIRNLTFPMLGACNVDVSREPTLRGLLRKFVVLEQRGIKVGVVGFLTPTTGTTARDVGGVRFSPIVPAVKACVAELRAAHPRLDYVIGLSHSGYDDDQETARALSGQGLDVIIGGHSHTFLHTPTDAGPIVTRGAGVNATNCVAKGACDKPAGPYPTWVAPPSGKGAPTPVVQAYYSSKYLGLIKVDLRSRTLLPAQPLLLGGANSSNPVAQDPALLAILDKYRGPVDKLQQQVTGRIAVPLEGDASISRVNETNFGNLVCEAFLAAAAPVVAKAGGGTIRICLMNAGGIRSGIPVPGEVTVGAVLTALPYANAVAIFSVSGQALLQAIANGFSAWPSGGRFLQVAGLRLWHRGGRLLSAALLDGPDGGPGAGGHSASGSGTSGTRPIDPAASYTIVSTDYMLQGGDGFTSFAKARVLLPAGEPYAEVVMAHLHDKLPEAVAPTTHSRIIDCAKQPSFAGCSAAAAAAA